MDSSMIKMSKVKKIKTKMACSKSKSLDDYALYKKVARKFAKLFSSGQLSSRELDEGEWALKALKKFPIDDALSILKEFMDSRLNHISKGGTHLCTTMRKHQFAINAKKIEKILEGTGYTLHAKFGLRKSVGPSNCDRSSGCEKIIHHNNLQLLGEPSSSEPRVEVPTKIKKTFIDMLINENVHKIMMKEYGDDIVAAEAEVQHLKQKCLFYDKYISEYAPLFFEWKKVQDSFKSGS